MVQNESMITGLTPRRQCYSHIVAKFFVQYFFNNNSTDEKPSMCERVKGRQTQRELMIKRLCVHRDMSPPDGLLENSFRHKMKRNKTYCNDLVK